MKTGWRSVSRNAYLSAEQKQAALVLNKSLRAARAMLAGGETDAKIVRSSIQNAIQSEPLAKIDYVEVVNSESLQPVARIEGPVLVALAVFFWKKRGLSTTSRSIQNGRRPITGQGGCYARQRTRKKASNHADAPLRAYRGGSDNQAPFGCVSFAHGHIRARTAGSAAPDQRAQHGARRSPMFANASSILLVVRAVMSGVLVYIIVRYQTHLDAPTLVALCFILAGALGNLFDQIFLGYVRDMIEFAFVRFAVFNVADSYVTVSTTFLLFYLLITKRGRTLLASFGNK